MVERLLLVELHGSACICGGGSHLVAVGQQPGCPGREGEETAILPYDLWNAIGKPRNAEAYRQELVRVAERRESPRFKVSVEVRLSLDDGPSALGVTENLGEGGAAILTPLVAETGKTGVLEDLEGHLRATARLVAVTEVVRGTRRINLRFLDPDAKRQVRKLLYVKSRRA